MTTCLVTGGAGFIGSHLVEALVARGDAVRVLDNFSTGKEENLSAVANRIELLRGDICDRDAVQKAMAGVRLVFHQAALVSVPRSMREPAINHAINMDGAFNVLEAAREAAVDGLVLASSAAVYGDLPGLPKTEDMPTAPTSPYGLAKLVGEQYARVYQQCYGLPTVALRYFNVYGPRQDPSSPYSGVISIFMDRLLTGSGVTIYGDGEQTRDFVYVGDVVRANLLAASSPSAAQASATSPGAAGQAFNVSTGHATTINTLWDTLQGLAGGGQPTRHAEARAGDIRHSVASPERARQVLGYEPATPLAEGLRRTLEWYRASR